MTAVKVRVHRGRVGRIEVDVGTRQVAPFVITLWHAVNLHLTKRESLSCSRDNDGHKSARHAAPFTAERGGFTCFDVADGSAPEIWEQRQI